MERARVFLRTGDLFSDVPEDVMNAVIESAQRRRGLLQVPEQNPNYPGNDGTGSRERTHVTAGPTAPERGLSQDAVTPVSVEGRH
ncbi:MAG: hypothetical protein MUF54_08995 [Polyangiaceae bacterium]|jgi:hypothetical protein|nr:hypothetical protein [Polyangiaceae bacterium]